MGKELIGERLKIIRQKLKLSQKEMASLLNVSLNAYQRYEMGSRGLNLDKMKILAQRLNINLHWLLTGEGEPFLTPKAEPVKKKTKQNCLLI